MPDSLREALENAADASPVAARPFASPKRGLIIATVGGLFMTFIGAMGTDAVPIGRRLAYWLLLMETGALIGIGVSMAVHQWGRLESRRVAEGALVSLLIAVPLTVLVVAVNALILDAKPSGAVEIATVGLVVLVVSAIVTTLNYATAPPLAAPDIPTPSPIVSLAVAPSRLMDRLPMRLRHARLIAIEAEDHYLRVHTDAGSDLILMRLGDAVAELDGLAGARVHRSWWVARDAVTDVQTTNGRTTLVLEHALSAPVSRNNRPALAKGGWLD